MMKTGHGHCRRAHTDCRSHIEHGNFVKSVIPEDVYSSLPGYSTTNHPAFEKLFFFFFVSNPDICISVELHAFSLAQDTNLIKTFLSILTVGSDTSYTHSLRSPLSLTFPKIKVIHFQLLISFQWLFTGVSQQAQDPGRTDVGEHSTTTQGSSPFHKSKSRPRIHLLFKQNTGKIKSDGRDIIRHL